MIPSERLNLITKTSTAPLLSVPHIGQLAVGFQLRCASMSKSNVPYPAFSNSAMKNSYLQWQAYRILVFVP